MIEDQAAGRATQAGRGCNKVTLMMAQPALPSRLISESGKTLLEISNHFKDHQHLSISLIFEEVIFEASLVETMVVLMCIQCSPLLFQGTHLTSSQGAVGLFEWFSKVASQYAKLSMRLYALSYRRTRCGFATSEFTGRSLVLLKMVGC